MEQFAEIAAKLIAISHRIISLNKQKTQFAKSINFQIPQLLQLLGQVSTLKGEAIIEQDKFNIQLSRKQKNLLNGCQTNRTYLTVDDLCIYLHANKSSMKRTNELYTLQQTSLRQFQLLLQKEQGIEDQLAGLLQQINLQRWFGEVDFFSNGYIDTSALYEYLLHYDQGSETLEEYNALLLLKTIKKQNHNDKVILQDLRDYIEPQEQIIPVLLTNDNLQESINHIHHRSKKNSVFSSQISLPSSLVKFGMKSVQNLDKKTVKTTLTAEQIQQQLKQHASITYEQRLIKLHSRNQKYIKQAKRQMEGVIPICNVQINSQLLLYNSKSDSSDLIIKIQLLADIYNRIVQQIQILITNNPKFTFINAFSMMDYEQQNSVSYDHWIKFMKQYNFCITNKKINNFFQRYSTKGLMTFSQYLRAFKYLGCQNQYLRCRERYPLIYEGWSEIMTENYKTCLSKMIRMMQERQNLKKSIQQKRQEITKMISGFTYAEQLMQLLGQQYKFFILEYCQDGVFQIQKLLDKN